MIAVSALSGPVSMAETLILKAGEIWQKLKQEYRELSKDRGRLSDLEKKNKTYF